MKKVLWIVKNKKLNVTEFVLAINKKKALFKTVLRHGGFNADYVIIRSRLHETYATIL